MPKPIALCIEDLEARADDERYLSCVAVAGRQAGLRLRGDGTVTWEDEEDVACEIWVSGDERLILFRLCSVPTVTLREPVGRWSSPQKNRL